MSRVILWTALAPLTLMFTAAASAEAQGPQLHYEVTPACPTRAMFEDLVQARLGRPPFGETASAVVVEITEDRTDLNGEIRWMSSEGELLGRRVVRTPRGQCRQLAESLAVAVAILLEDPPDAAVPAEPAAEPTTEPESPAVPETQPTDEPHALQWAGSFGLTSSIGTTPRPTLGANFRFGFRGRRIGAYLRLGIDSQLVEAQTGEDRIDAQHYHVTLDVCAHSELGVFGCLSVSGGAFQAKVHTVVDPMSRTTLTLLAGLAVGWELAVSQTVSIVPWVTGLVGVRRAELRVAGAAIWESAPVAVRLGLDLQVNL